MIGSTASVGLWLLQQASVFPDTVVTKAADPGVFGKIAAVASTLMTISLLVLAIFLVPAAWNFRNSYKRVNQLLERVYGDINPIMRHASSIADNVDYITTSIRTDVQQVNATVAAANQRLHQAIALTEERLSQFSALIEVVQQEAEQLFLSTASAARGVRAGARSLAGGRPVLDGAEPLLDLAGEEAAERQAQEEEHGDDIDDATEARSARPRVRPRPRRRDWA